MGRLLTAITVAAGVVVGGLAANAAPMGTLPEAGAASAVIPVRDYEALGFECFWSRGCKYCRASVHSHWVLVYCKKRKGH